MSLSRSRPELSTVAGGTVPASWPLCPAGPEVRLRNGVAGLSPGGKHARALWGPRGSRVRSDTGRCCRHGSAACAPGLPLPAVSRCRPGAVGPRVAVGPPRGRSVGAGGGGCVFREKRDSLGRGGARTGTGDEGVASAFGARPRDPLLNIFPRLNEAPQIPF